MPRCRRATPDRAVELGLPEYRHLLFCLLGAPQNNIDAKTLTDGGVAFELFPTVAAAQQKRTVWFELHRIRPIGRNVAQKRRSVAGQLRQLRFGHALAQHRRVAAR